MAVAVVAEAKVPYPTATVPVCWLVPLALRAKLPIATFLLKSCTLALFKALYPIPILSSWPVAVAAVVKASAPIITFLLLTVITSAATWPIAILFSPVVRAFKALVPIATVPSAPEVVPETPWRAPYPIATTSLTTFVVIPDIAFLPIAIEFWDKVARFKAFVPIAIHSSALVIFWPAW